MKFLHVRSGFQCSLHRHLVKDETFIIQSGTIKLEHGEETRWLHPGDSQRITPGTWHRFTNEGSKAAVVMEISTHHDDEDVQRKEESKQISGQESRTNLQPATATN